jgi:hypothetical protein
MLLLSASAIAVAAMPAQVCASPRPAPSNAKSSALKPIPVAVFGTDDRVALPAAMRPLRERMGVLFNTRHKTVCTAFCVAPDVIGTAAHCLYKTKGEKRARLSDFWFARNYDAMRDYARIAGSDAGSTAQSVIAGSVELSTKPPIDATKDWAFVKLATAVCRKGIFEIDARPVEAIIREAKAGRIYQISYHKDFKQWQPAYSRPCNVERSFSAAPWPTISADFDSPEHLVLHTCDTGGASSGSPLLVDTPTGPKVVAINVGTYVQSRSVLHEAPADGVTHSDAVANTAVSATAFARQLAAFSGARMLITNAQLRELQEQLRRLALYSGASDATYGPTLKTAIEAYEKSIGLPPTGLATEEILLRLLQRKPGSTTAR